MAMKSLPLAAMLLLALPCAAGAQTAAAPLPADHPSIKAAAGPWELVSAGGKRCLLRLNAPGNDKAALPRLGLPAACKLAIPALAPVAAWGLTGEGALLLRKADGAVLLSAIREGEGPMRGALGPESVTLAPVGGRYPDKALLATRLSAAAGPTRNQTPAVAEAPPPAPEAIPGTYALIRDGSRELCRIILDGAQKQGRSLARFAGLCPDGGMTIFDPVGWGFENGRLILIARKGHKVSLSYGADGRWRRDPPSGAPLLLRKLSP